MLISFGFSRVPVYVCAFGAILDAMGSFSASIARAFRKAFGTCGLGRRFGSWFIKAEPVT